MKRCVKKLFTWTAVFSFTVCHLYAFAEENSSNLPPVGGQHFNEQKEEGWFWKKTPPLPAKKPELVKKEKLPAPVTPPVKEIPPPAPAVKPEIPAFTVAWFRENMQKIRDRAIDNPTRENVRAYYLVQRVALDKASKFTDMARIIMATDPLVDTTAERSHSSFAALEQSRLADAAKSSVLRNLSARAGLFFFFRGKDCPLCEQQVPPLQAFNFMTGMKVIPISVDGHPLAGNPFNGWRADSGQAEKLNLKTFPALALAIPELNSIRVVSFGPVSTDNLIDKTVLIAHDAGAVTDKEYASTLPYNIIEHGDFDANAMQDVTPEILADPNKLIDFFQKKAGILKEVTLQEKPQ